MPDGDAERKGPGAAAVEVCNGREEGAKLEECGAEEQGMGSRTG